MSEQIKFNNPRLNAEFSDWPIGGQSRGQCKFTVETHIKRGQRVSRTTTDKFGRWHKPKYSVYGIQTIIVDGSDGRTYILQRTIYNSITVMRHDFMSPERNSVIPTDPDYAEIATLFNSVQ